MSNVIQLTTQADKEKSLQKQGLEEVAKILGDQFANTNVRSIVAVVYYKDEDPETVNYYIAGDYTQDRQILGDIRMLEQSVLEGEI